MRLFEEFSIDGSLRRKGFIDPYFGDDKHVTWRHSQDKTNQILLDYDGDEWHYSTDGNVIKVGKMTDDSLKDFLDSL